MPTVHHRAVTVDGLDVFYRESGPEHAPVLVLLHGYPTSSHMFRHLIPALAETYRVLAPDHIGFGRSSAPSADDFAYTFDALAEVTRGFLRTLNITTYTVYVQDYGAPIAWRLALAEPGALEGVISQNGNAYEEGFVQAFWDPIWAYAADRSESNEAALRPALERGAVEWQYTHGVPDVTTIDPDAWEHDLALLNRPGTDRAQLDLFADYVTNRRLYPAIQDWLGASQIPVLAVWGRNDEIFSAAGAEAFRRDVAAARVELLDGGHFLLESHLDQVVHIVREWQTQQQTISTS
ncbi:alpha/beta hydrolase [Arthrobacter tumbae]|uniref:alpha/beta fold hydrolase n=1 Tax=Arthrobacter tumbae TaxID=163874 RepID=UPI00195E3956|nr:alpha/beta hydrolase [Arthrobacter tumbae]MBM7781098.1 pimeloyl-ACP methyl ester carboxylesterase [Arthrobacter tumbae]